MRGVQFPFVVNDFVLIKVSELNRAGHWLSASGVVKRP